MEQVQLFKIKETENDLEIKCFTGITNFEFIRFQETSFFERKDEVGEFDRNSSKNIQVLPSFSETCPDFFNGNRSVKLLAEKYSFVEGMLEKLKYKPKKVSLIDMFEIMRGINVSITRGGIDCNYSDFLDEGVLKGITPSTILEYMSESYQKPYLSESTGIILGLSKNIFDNSESEIIRERHSRFSYTNTY